MRRPSKTVQFSLGLAFALILPFSAHAQLIFSDSFENENGYNLPNSSSTPPWNAPVFTGVLSTTVGDSNYNSPNGGPTQVVQTMTGTNSSVTPPIPGQDGINYLALNNSGGASDNDNGPTYSNRTPSAQSDTLTSANGAAGVFAANTTYTLSVLMAGPGTASGFTGTLYILDGTTVTGSPTTSSIAAGTLASSVIDFGTVADNDFHQYTLTFDTATNPALATNADSIQIGLAFASPANFPFNRGGYFDSVTLTAILDVPEPSTWAMMITGLLILVGLRARLAFRRIP